MELRASSRLENMAGISAEKPGILPDGLFRRRIGRLPNIFHVVSTHIFDAGRAEVGWGCAASLRGYTCAI